MTTRSNNMHSPLVGDDELNSGFSTSKNVKMKPHLRGMFEASGRPPAFPSVLDRNYHQKSEMMNSTEQKDKEHIPKLILTQPLQFQKTRRTHNESTGRGGIVSINSTAASVDNNLLTAEEERKNHWQAASLD